MPPACDRFLPPDLPAERVAARIGLVSDTHMPERCIALPAAITGADLLAELRASDLPGDMRARIESVLAR